MINSNRHSNSNTLFTTLSILLFYGPYLVNCAMDCPRYICSDLSRNIFTNNQDNQLIFCYYSSATNPLNIYIDDQICHKYILDQKHYCTKMDFDLDDYTGLSLAQVEEMKKTKAICRGVSDFEEPLIEIRLPGEECDNEQRLYICAFGKKLCFNGRCVGYNENDKIQCYYNEDCNPYFYCDQKVQRCQPYKKLAQKCNYHYECGRNMLCRKFKVGATAEDEGECTEFFSLEKDEIIDVKDTNFWIQLLCKDGFADVYTDSDKYISNKKCGYRIESLNAGSLCTDDKDCESNMPGLFSKCKCTNNSYGNAYCEYQSGNSQWDNVVQLFKEYFDLTKSCHVARGLGHHCFQYDETAKYLCKIDLFRRFEKTYKAAGC